MHFWSNTMHQPINGGVKTKGFMSNDNFWGARKWLYNSTYQNAPLSSACVLSNTAHLPVQWQDIKPSQINSVVNSKKVPASNLNFHANTDTYMYPCFSLKYGCITKNIKRVSIPSVTLLCSLREIAIPWSTQCLQTIYSMEDKFKLLYTRKFRPWCSNGILGSVKWRPLISFPSGNCLSTLLPSLFVM